MKGIINQAHWFGDVEITDVAGMEKVFTAPVDTLHLEFKAVAGVAYYKIDINPDAYQGTGSEESGDKKWAGGLTWTINSYRVKKFTVVAYDSGDAAIALGEVGYAGFMTNSSVASYQVVIP